MGTFRPSPNIHLMAAGSVSRRRLLAQGGGIAGLAALGFVGCSSSTNSNKGVSPTRAAAGSSTATQIAQRTATAAPLAGSPGAGIRTATPAGASQDTQGKPGGTLYMQTAGYPATFAIAASRTGGT